MKTPLSDSLIETLLREGLPPPDTRRWVVRRKAAVVVAVRSGMITVEQACQVYQLTEEELLSRTAGRRRALLIERLSANSALH